MRKPNKQTRSRLAHNQEQTNEQMHACIYENEDSGAMGTQQQAQQQHNIHSVRHKIRNNIFRARENCDATKKQEFFLLLSY
mmetsp:Transcript_17000/g.47719  ORF Transcript_17000/g.47719 Transcript_17000/m.47719 type:complete len:81 (-) Transcript_17000:87-329(-)